MQGSRNHLGFAFLTFLHVSCLLLAPGIVRAKDIIQLMDGSDYDPLEPLLISSSEIRVYAAKTPPTSGEGLFVILIYPHSATEPAYSYRVDRDAPTGETATLSLRLLGSEVKADGQRVVTCPLPVDKAEYDVAVTLVEQAEKAADDWGAHNQYVADSNSPDSARARPAWRRIVTSLEHARDKYPDHLGILLDLIIAYTQLNAYEAGTTRGVNLCLLIPAAITEFEARAGALSASEQRALRRARTLLNFQVGLYPIARDELDAGVDDAELSSVRRALEALGQAEFDRKEVFEVDGGIAPYQVTVYSARGRSYSEQVLFDLWYFVPRPNKPQALGRVWYSLARQTVSGKPRHYLYAHAGHERTLLMLYGENEPSYEKVKDQIRSMMMAALVVPKSDPASWFWPVSIVLLLGLVLLLALSITLRKRRTARLAALLMGISLGIPTALLLAQSGNKPIADATASDDELEKLAKQLRDSLKNAGKLHHGQDEKPDVTPDSPTDPPREDGPPVPPEVKFPTHDVTVPRYVYPKGNPQAEQPAQQVDREVEITIPPQLMARIVRSDLRAADVVRRELQRAGDSDSTLKEFAARLAEEITRRTGEADAIDKLSERRVEIHPDQCISAHLDALQKVEEISRAAPALQSPDSASALAYEAFQLSEQKRAPLGVPDGGPSDIGTQFFALLPPAADVPILKPAIKSRYRAPPSPPTSQPNEVPAFRPQGVMIHVDESMLAEALRASDAEVVLKEIVTLENAVLAASDGTEVFQKVHEYTEAKKAAFLAKAQKFHTLGDVRLVSLRTLSERLQVYLNRWDERSADLRTVGGLTRIYGFLHNEATNDLLLVGQARAGDPPIMVDDLITGLRAVWRDGLTPGCSLDCGSNDLAGPHLSRILGVPNDSHFAKVMLDADYGMKRIMLEADGEKLEIPGYQSEVSCRLEQRSPDAAPLPETSRFWLFPVQPSAREIQLAADGTFALFDARVQVLTEALAFSEHGMEGMGSTYPTHQQAARSFTDNYDQIAEVRPVFKQLQGLFDIALLGKVLRLTSPGDPFLTYLVSLPYTHVKVPESYVGLSVKHSRDGRTVVATGGCDIRARAHLRNIVEVGGYSLPELVEAGRTLRSDDIGQNVPGLTLRVPVVRNAAMDEAQQAYDAGLHHLAAEEFGAADEQLSRAIDADEKFAEAYAKRALARFFGGRRRAALWDAAKAIDLNPHDPSTEVAFLRLMLEAGLNGWVKSPEKAAEAEDIASLYTKRGFDKLSRKLSQEELETTKRLSRKEFEEMSNEEQQEWTRLENRHKANQREALQDMDKAVKLAPYWSGAYASRGIVRLALGDDQGAKDDCDKAIAINPKEYVARWTRGTACMSLDDFAGAIQDFDAFLEKYPNDGAGYYNRANAKCRKGDLQGWAADLHAALMKDPNLAILLDMKNIEENCARLLESDARCDNAHLLRGTVLRLRGDLKGAQEAFRKLLGVNHPNVEGLKQMAEVLLELKEDLISAEAFAAMAISEAKEQRADLYYVLGMVRRERAHEIALSGDQSRLDERIALNLKAEEDFTQAIERDPTHYNAYRYRSGTRALIGKLEQAISDMDECIKLEPTNGRAYELRGMLLAAAGRKTEAIQDLEVAKRLDPGRASEVDQILERVRQVP